MVRRLATLRTRCRIRTARARRRAIPELRRKSERSSPEAGASLGGERGDRVMRQLLEELYWRNLRASAKGMSRSSYALLGGMVVSLIAVAVIATLGWNAAAGTDVRPFGYAAMAAGILFSLAVGVGLMALVFYSSRAGYDEP